MKSFISLITIILILGLSQVCAQNSPLFLWGTGLDGSDFQKTAIYSDAQVGLRFEAPLTSTGVKLPIELNWRGGGVSTLKILANGNVGVGIVNPKSKLDVSGQMSSYLVGIGQLDVNTGTKNIVNFASNNHGSVLISSNLYFSGDDSLRIANTHFSLSGASILMPGNSRPNQGGIVFYTNQPSAVVADASYTGAVAMLIKSDGNVGIGTTNPGQYKLAVEGTIGTRRIKVTQVLSWADFVFHEDYKLSSLEYVERFIQENKHLPDIPSEKQVREDGFDVGEMNKRLLQKIEELTLYMIDMKKTNDALKMELEQLKQLLKN